MIKIGETEEKGKYVIEGYFEDIKSIADILKDKNFKDIFHKNFIKIVLREDVRKSGEWRIIFDGHIALLDIILNLCNEIKMLRKQLEDEMNTTYCCLLKQNVMEHESNYLTKSVMYLKKAYKACTAEEKRKAYSSYRRNILLLRNLSHNHPEYINKKRSDIYDKL